jgi:transmembrane protein
MRVAVPRSLAASSAIPSQHGSAIAGALGVFTALATMMVHRFWALDGIERVRELNTFLEHLAIIAGFVLVAILGVVGARGRG